MDESDVNIGDPNTEFISIGTKNTISILENIKSIDECNVQCFTNSDCKKYTYSPSLEMCKLSNEYGILSKSENLKAEWTTRLVMEPFENVKKCKNNDYAPLLIFIILLLAVILCLKYN
jgi:cytochrome c-type biogenesis protein CcmH/NrfG